MLGAWRIYLIGLLKMLKSLKPPADFPRGKGCAAAMPMPARLGESQHAASPQRGRASLFVLSHSPYSKRKGMKVRTYKVSLSTLCQLFFFFKKNLLYFLCAWLGCKVLFVPGCPLPSVLSEDAEWPAQGHRRSLPGVCHALLAVAVPRVPPQRLRCSL